jgi:hypothetical protein
MGTGITYIVESQFCKGKVVRAQLYGDDRKLYGIGVVDWTNHRPISRSSVKPRDAGDCMMNESWQEPGRAEISCAGSG